MAEQGLHLAAARLQALARGARARKLLASIWKQAKEYALNVVWVEREARMKTEADKRTKQKVWIELGKNGRRYQALTTVVHSHYR